MNVLPDSATLGSFFIVLVLILLATLLLTFKMRKLISLSSRSYDEITASLSKFTRVLMLCVLWARDMIRSTSIFDYDYRMTSDGPGWMNQIPLLLRALQSACLNTLKISVSILGYAIMKLQVQRSTVLNEVKFHWWLFIIDILALLLSPLWLGMIITTSVVWSSLALISLVLSWLLYLGRASSRLLSLLQQSLNRDTISNGGSKTASVGV